LKSEDSDIEGLDCIHASDDKAAMVSFAPLLGHSIPESLEIIAADRRLPRLPMFRINLYIARNPSPAARAFADHVRRSVAASGIDRSGK
jgi:hypothetical protein